MGSLSVLRCNKHVARGDLWFSGLGYMPCNSRVMSSGLACDLRCVCDDHPLSLLLTILSLYWRAVLSSENAINRAEQLVEI